MRVRAILLTLTLALVAAAAPAAGAQTITPTTTEDLPADAFPLCPAFGALQCTLRAALVRNDIDGGNDTIVLPAGHYALSSPLSEQQPVTIEGQGAAGDTVIDAAGQPGAFVFAPALAQKPFTLTHLTVQGARGGPGIVSNGAEPLTLDDVVVRDNVNAPNQRGGGLLVNGGAIAIRASVIADNAVIGDDGGAAIALENTQATIVASELRGNQTPTNNGNGTVLVDGTTTLGIAGSRLTGNHAYHGGGVYVSALATGLVTIANSTFDRNVSASDDGAGIAISDASTAKVLASNDTFIGNGDADAGAAGPTFLAAGQLRLQDSAVVNAGSACGQSGSVTSLGHNVIDDASCGLAGAGDRQSIDPRLGPVAGNGGPTFSALPSADSPLLDAGDPSACPPTDQRGVARPQGAGCDIGAVERTPGAPGAVTGGANGLTVTGTVDPGGQPTTVTVEYGRTASYGNTRQLPAVAGWPAHAVSVTLTKIAPATLVHYRVLAANGSGHAIGGDRVLRAPGIVVSHLKISPHTVRTKATLRWSATSASKVRFTVEVKRRVKHKLRWVATARFTFSGKAGSKNRRGVPRSVLRHLHAGSHRLSAAAIAHPAVTPSRTTFRYAPPRH